MDIYEKLDRYTKYSFGIIKEKCDLIYEDIELDKINFSKYDLNNSTFAGVVFKECDFSGVYLSGSFFGGSIFKQCILKKIYCIKHNGIAVNLNNVILRK